MNHNILLAGDECYFYLKRIHSCRYGNYFKIDHVF